MKVLADTSVWVAHFKQPNALLSAMLGADQVMMHPMVLGEIACGTPPDRKRTLVDLATLGQVNLATVDEVVAFVERERLYGRGCGLVDLILLASTLMTLGALLWTVDKRLADLAEPLGVLYRPSIH